MSLISDTDFLIHSLRLAYLREVEDPYGPRVISFDPAYHSNPYIAAASLADVDRWPELGMSQSPQLSEDDQERPLGFPGARLKYTQTIMGGKSGAVGIRVNGKRASTSKRMSATPRQSEVKNFVPGGAPVQETLGTTVPTSGSLVDGDATDSWVKVDQAEKETSPSPQPNVQVQGPTAVEEAPVTKVVPFVPKFRGADEMAARRRIRLAARRGPGGALPAAQPLPTFDSSSSSDEDIPLVEESSSDEFGGDMDARDSMDEGDEFDPEFAATRPAVISGSSDMMSVFSAGADSISNSSAPMSPPHTNHRSRPRLSPVSEAARLNHVARNGQRDKFLGSFFEMVTPPPGTKPENGANQPISTPGSEPLFTRKKVTPIKPLKSALSSMLASSSGSSNPFAEMYAAISGRGESASTKVRVYFPHAREPAGKAMELGVRRDATVEEVVGFALWNYWEERWLPKLDDGLSGEDDPKWKSRLSAVGWILRITEDDGEVDDDFPPPDRMGKIMKFNSEAYAILEATPAQIQQNQVLETKIQRRPSRTTASKKSDRLVVPGSHVPAVAPGSVVYGSTLGSVLSTSLGPSSSHGPQIFLRIRVDTADAVHVSTTIPVSAGMYMQEALELVCRKRKLPNPKDHALLLMVENNKRILIPLDRTVASLQGKRELLLVKRNMLPGDTVTGIGKTTDPNASIFKRMSDTPEVQYSSDLDYAAAYKKYTIYRKMPMLVARQERTLAIDGVYIHIMPPPSKAKAVFDSGKTSSYHIKSIADCQQSAKTSSVFKLVLNRGAGSKRYDFEAESPKLAAEIVQTIKSLKAALERSGTVNKLRRSRHVT
ncbi:stress-activated map kinase interacting protein 1-domain-containing protein [Crucibulum laeve]|uniref:Stress-activated map kinase interacting protein 1-domain-containing protein n=1 Tax=Crucibulum laeve TaxID=68775 RepID=A0A5C3M7Z5_9AGAR|nr:stress-activated map kinase interacting protein 1-domain-containing protein [Crucibulum laeve]